jgi:hypothetical protein
VRQLRSSAKAIEFGVLLTAKYYYFKTPKGGHNRPPLNVKIVLALLQL